MADRTGQQLGNYYLARLLGRGGFAQIYLGEHLRLKTRVAIKVLSISLTGKEMEHLLTEAQMIARLEHPHIVRLLDFAVEDDTPFLVMSYAPNGNLRQRHPKGSCLPLETIQLYLEQVASALQYAHDEKVIHRDIKPENLLLDQHGKIVLSDFGIAVAARSSLSLSTQEVTGTVTYMAPEQLQGKPRLASDQYAVAVMIYEWLCGSPPFQGTPAEIITQHISAAPPPLHKRLPTIPPELEKVMFRALEKDPHRRYGSMQEFASAFALAHQEQPTLPPDYGRSKSLVLGSAPESTTAPAGAALLQGSKAKGRSLSRRRLMLGCLIGLAGLTGAGTVSAAWLSSLQRSPGPAKPQAGQTLVVYQEHASAVKTVAWSPDGKRLVSSGDSFDISVHVWDAATGKRALTPLKQTTNVNALAWAVDGLHIAVGNGNGFFPNTEHTAQIWDMTTGGWLRTYAGHTRPVRAVAWSPDGTRVASAGEDKTVQVWDAMSGAHRLTYTGHSSTVLAVAWSSDGTRIASASDDKTVQIWDASTLKRLFTLQHTSTVNSVAWSPDSIHIATGSGNAFWGGEHNAYVWNSTTGKRLFTCPHAGVVNSVAWSPDGKHIISGCNDKSVQIWDGASGDRVFTYRGHTLGVTQVAWCPVDNLIASASNDGTVRVWRAR